MSERMLTFLQDPTELDWVMHHRAGALDHPIVTFDLELHCELTDRGIDHQTPWDIIKPDDRAVLERIEQSAQRFWQDHAAVWHRDVNLLAIAAHRHVSALSRMVWAGFVVERAIAQQSPDRIFLFDFANAHGLQQPPDCRRLPLLFGIVESIAHGLNLPIERMSEGAQQFFEDNASTQAHRSDLPAVDDARWGDEPFVLLTGSGHDLDQQLPIIRRIEATDNLRAIQVYRHADAPTLNRLKANGHLVVHDSQLPFQPMTGIESASAKGRQNFARALASLDDRSAYGFARWIPESHLEFVFGEYAGKLASHVDRWHAFFDRHRPIAFVGHYPDTAMELAHRRGIRTLLLPHGGLSIGDAPWYRSLPKVTLGVEGERHAEHLQSLGIESDRIIPIESGDPVMPSVPGIDTKRRNIDRFELLLVTSRLADHAHDAELPGLNWNAAIRSLEEIFNFAGRHKDWHFTVKPHPRYDHTELYRHLLESLPSAERFRIETVRSLAECADGADVIVFANVTSTGILESARSGKPVILLRDSTAVLHRNPRDELLSEWPRVSSASELESYLERLATDESAHKSAATQTARALENFFGRRPETGSLMEFILRKKKARNTDEGNPCPVVCVE